MNKLNTRNGRSSARSAYLLIAGLCFAQTSWADVPEPNAVYYGSVQIAGAGAPNGTAVSARIGTDVLATTQVGSAPAPAGSYLLRVPLAYTLAGEARPTGHARIGDAVQIVVNQSVARDVTIRGRGEVVPLDLSITTPGGTAFLVCDVAPPLADLNSDGDQHDVNEFGNSTLNNADVVTLFKTSLLAANRPPSTSDLFSAMDA